VSEGAASPAPAVRRGKRADPDPPATGPGARGSWARRYVIVLAALALDILLLWWLTERYR
jgi:hypothetical protein